MGPTSFANNAKRVALYGHRYLCKNSNHDYNSLLDVSMAIVLRNGGM